MAPKRSTRSTAPKPKTTKVTKPKIVKRKAAAPSPLCAKGALKRIDPLIAQLDSVIANKGAWCDGNHFAPARALLYSWANEQTDTVAKLPKQLNKLDAKTIFIDPIVGHLNFAANNKDWCDGQTFGTALGSLQTWLDGAAKDQLCKQGALNAIYPIADELLDIIETKGTWCDGNRFVPAHNLLLEWAKLTEKEFKKAKKD